MFSAFHDRSLRIFVIEFIAMIKLVVTDMDGSLLNDAKQLPADFFEIAAGLQRQGIVFAVASGRQYYTLLHTFFELRDSVYFIAENGAYVAFQDKALHIDFIDRKVVNELIAEGRNVSNAFPILCGKNSAYAESNDVGFLDEARKYYQKFEIVDDLTLVEDEIFKFTVCDFSNAEFNSLKYFQKYNDQLKVAVGGELYLDITSHATNKGNALRQLQKKLGIKENETLVFGDYLNDLEMMGAATYSYAMKNAHPEIINVANFTTEFDNNHGGVTQTIRKLCLSETQLTMNS